MFFDFLIKSFHPDSLITLSVLLTNIFCYPTNSHLFFRLSQDQLLCKSGFYLGSFIGSIVIPAFLKLVKFSGFIALNAPLRNSFLLLLDFVLCLKINCLKINVLSTFVFSFLLNLFALYKMNMVYETEYF